MADDRPLRGRLERRLEQLQAEFETGQKLLADLEAQQSALRDTMLRLVGAITVLREELGTAAQNGREEPADGGRAGEAADARTPG